ncbi:hypothetical protein V6N13_109589 [Hibiscus sabdariffa]
MQIVGTMGSKEIVRKDLGVRRQSGVRSPLRPTLVEKVSNVAAEQGFDRSQLRQKPVPSLRSSQESGGDDSRWDVMEDAVEHDIESVEGHGGMS